MIERRHQFGLVVLAILSFLSIAGQARTDTDARDDREPDEPPRLMTFVDATYPPDALREGREGAVLLELFVTAAGLVDSVRVVGGLADDLDAAAAAAAAGFVYAPALAAGEPVPVYVHFEYVFSISEQTRRIGEYVNFRGRLREMGTRAPLSGAMVVAAFPDSARPTLDVPWEAYLERIGRFAGQYREGDRLVVFTDHEGRFELRSLPPGPVVFTFPNAGFQELTEREHIRPGEVIEVEYWARRSRYNAYEIVVYGRGEQKEVTRQTLSVTEVERMAGFGGDVVKSIQALPGVARPTMADPGAVIVRGSGNYDSRFFLDGIDVPLLFHYGGLKSTYNSLALASVDMYPGGFGTGYGGAIGGVVELKGRSGRRDRWHRVLDASLLDASFHAEGPLGDRAALIVTGRRSFIGEVIAAALEQTDEVAIAVAPYYWDVVGRLDWDAADGHRLFATAFAVQDRMSMIVSDAAEGSAEVNAATDEIAMDIRFSRFIVGWDAHLGARARNTLRAAYGRQRESGHVFGWFDWLARSPLWQVRDEFVVDWTPWLRSTLGGELIRMPYRYEVQAAGWRRSLATQTFGLQGAWANLELRPRPQLLLVPGVRHDRYDHLDKGAVSTRGHGRWQYRDDRALTASYGSYNQMPQPVGQSTDPVYGNPDLPPTLARHATLGHEWRLGDRLSLKVEGYHNTQRKIPSPTDSLGLNFVPDTDARMYGVEFMLRHEPNERFFGWISYSLGRAERRHARRPSLDIGPDWDPADWVLYGHDQTHHLEAVASWNLRGNWSLGGRLQYVSGVPTIPLLSYTSGQFEFDADTGDYLPIGGRYFSDRMEPYVRLDVRLDRKWVKRSSIWSVYLDLQNLNALVYNSPEGHTYNYDYSKRSEYGWIIIPALGARVEF